MNNYRRFFMWALPLTFFTFQFVLRLWPSLMMQQIMQQYMIDATSFGLLASSYYYGYAGMQIPVALLLDKIGPRFVLFGCAGVCGVATLLFTYSNDWTMALISRFLIGAGSAAGFLATSKVISQWFAKEHYGRMVGFSFSIGLMGAIYGGKPIGLLVDSLGWQSIALTLGCVCIGIGFLALLFIRSPENEVVEPFKLSDLKSVITSPTLVVLAIANLLMVGALEGFADVWGVNYLMSAYQIAKVDAASLVSFIFVGMLFGGPVLSFFSKRFGNLRVVALSGFGLAILFVYMLIGQVTFNEIVLKGIFFITGILCCYQVLVFAAASDFVSARRLGISVAFLNCVNMLGGSFFHSLIGFSMDFYWTGEVLEGVRQYALGTYKNALLLIPMCAVIGMALVMFMRRPKADA